MKALKTLLLVAACLLCKPLFAQQEKPETYISAFFAEYRASPMSAVDKLYATNTWMSNAKEAIAGLKTKLSALTPDYVGTYYGEELILTKEVNGRLKLYSYMAKYDRQPIRFTFVFYKANDKWRLHKFRFDDELDDELDKLAKLDAFPNPVNVYRVN